MTVADMVIGLGLFCGLLALGTVILNVLLTTPAHRDARRRADLGDKWWRA